MKRDRESGVHMDPHEGSWLSGKLLVAMPSMPDQRFARSVIFVCSHSPEGAMGLVVNRLYGEINFNALLNQLDVKPTLTTRDIPVHFGGPVEPMRGFVLHSADYRREGTIPVDGKFALTSTVEVLHAMAQGAGPEHAMLALGYTGWGPGQLEEEIQGNGWLVAESTTELVFGTGTEGKWIAALASLGISPTSISSETGRA